VGRCSLTVALPVLSAAGARASALPTAVLSTHTGGFSGYTFRDLTDDILPIMEHWKTLGIRFDAVYSGYLGSARQLALVEGLIERFGEGASVLIDPVMADNGRLYANFSPEFPEGMRGLCARRAEIITPNLTEALFLMGGIERYHEGPHTAPYIEDVLRGLSEVLSGGALKSIVMTGLRFNEEECGAAVYDRAAGETHLSRARLVPGFYHGTGDLFASVFLAAYMNGARTAEAADIAVEYAAEAIALTRDAGCDTRYGVLFEPGLGALARRLRGE
jgi:pyridoxine kinase